MSKLVVINATAAIEGGALIVLRQLLFNSPNLLRFIVFVSVDFDKLPKLDQIKYINPNAKSGLNRLYWDNFGLNSWCKTNHVKPTLIISMQNTGVKVDGNVKQLIYYHQTIPLYPYSWSLFKKSERNLWFYKNVYPFFVKQHVNDSTIFVVQFEWIKRELVKRLSIAPRIVNVVNPTASEIDDSLVYKLELSNKFNIFYPASHFNFKNHLEIVKGLDYLKQIGRNLSNLKIYFTLNKSAASALASIIYQYGLHDHFEFVGTLSFNKVLQYYKSCDLVVFPSFLESFGLPLVEAAKFGKKILAADLDYAREVLAGYDGVMYLPIHNPHAWGDAIYKCSEQQEQFNSWEPEFAKNSWGRFFELVENFIRK